jgi:hypothetical protein
VRLSNGYSLLNLCERAALTELSGGLQPPDAIRVLFLVQQRAKPVAVAAVVAATCGIFRWRQVTVFDSFLRFFLCHFILLSCFGLAFRELSS